MDNKDRWKGFSTEEIYMLKRQAMEGSFEIMMGDKGYDKCQQQMHSDLLNELADELKARDGEIDG